MKKKKLKLKKEIKKTIKEIIVVIMSKTMMILKKLKNQK